MITGKTYGYARVSSSGQDYGIREAARSGRGLARRRNLSAVGAAISVPNASPFLFPVHHCCPGVPSCSQSI
jgi:hypothetical protein